MEQVLRAGGEGEKKWLEMGRFWINDEFRSSVFWSEGQEGLCTPWGHYKERSELVLE